MQEEPFSGVAMPLEVEAVAADPVEAGERSVELFAEIVRESRAVALDEAILGGVPHAEDIDGIVELRRPDGGQEARLEELVGQVLAGGGHCRFFYRGETGGSHGAVVAHAASVRLGTGSCQFHGRSSSSRVVGDAVQHIGEPGLWVDVVELGGADQRVDGRGAFAVRLGTEEQEVLAGDGDGAQGPSDGASMRAGVSAVSRLVASVRASPGTAPNGVGSFRTYRFGLPRRTFAQEVPPSS
jgi:hypothetical protein